WAGQGRPWRSRGKEQARQHASSSGDRQSILRRALCSPAGWRGGSIQWLPGGGMSIGVILSVLASVLFGGLYYFSTLLAPLDGEQIFGWRMLLTFPFVTLFMLWAGYWPLARELAGRLRRRPV